VADSEHPRELINYIPALQTTSEQSSGPCYVTYFHYPNPKIIKFVCIYVIYVLNILKKYTSQPQNIYQISLIKVGSIFFLRPEAVLTKVEAIQTHLVSADVT
jgi:hypothetical protein